jgi:hypothetical protein
VRGVTSTRGVFDKETRRKPLAFAADAALWGLKATLVPVDLVVMMSAMVAAGAIGDRIGAAMEPARWGRAI